MFWFLIALSLYGFGGLASLMAGRNAKAACAIGPAGAVAAGLVVLFHASKLLISGNMESLRMAWPAPFGSFYIAMDPLSALFAAVIAVVTCLAAVYGSKYLMAYAGQKNLGVSWFFFNMLAACMLLVVVARNVVLFLLSWELMSLTSFFLVMLEDEKERIRRAGWIYLVAMHLGATFLFAMFLLLGQNAESLDFNRLAATPENAGILFLLAVVGFGTKAGLMPLHVWLPEAHPAAPSHVSAVMSGVMIKTGIYGLFRMLTLLGPPPAWWGWTLIGIGIVSGILGVLYALAQHDLKRLLAYCSVENIGVILLGMGVGLLGVCYNEPAMAALGFAGALLHVVNHAVFKSLLFLGAGAVLHATDTRDLNRLGGLLKRMPTTGATFLIGAAAISGLPPLNGFVSEFLIFLGGLAGLDTEVGDAMAWPLMGVIVIGGMALIGGLASVCFIKAFGSAFLGEPRSPEAARAHEAGAAMRWPMLILAGLCSLIALAAPLWPQVLEPVISIFMPASMRDAASASLEQSVGPLVGVAFGSLFFLTLLALAVSVRKRLLANRSVEHTVTWGCGYVATTPRVQYTASSLTRPVTTLFRLFLQPHDEIHEPRGLFPQNADLHTRTPDLFQQRVYQPFFLGVAWVASRLRWLQQGRIQAYVLYIAVTILVLLIWKLR